MILVQTRYALIFQKLISAVLLFTFSGFAWYALSSNLETIWVIVGLVGIFIVITASILFEMSREEVKVAKVEVKEAKEEVKEAEEKVQSIVQEAKVLSEYRLTTNTLGNLTDIMRDFLSHREESCSMLDTVNLEGSSTTKIDEAIYDLKTIGFGTEKRKEMLIERTLRRICDTFESDPVQDTTSAGLHTYFKATIFEPTQDEAGKGVLSRTYFAYPRGLTPVTLEMREEDYVKRPDGRKPAALICWRTQTMVVVEDVENEQTKWVSLYEGQEKKFKSMVCYPIVRGKPGSEKSQVLGVLTIDTNRERYFKDNIFYSSFLTDILHPFSVLITYIYETSKMESKVSSMIEYVRESTESTGDEKLGVTTS